ncbi:MAG: hypothetical protein JMN24_06175 [gamma proteobacterium endosymbiont of Lamellibrachia anaximandri]|nr:hypothetical protein [gamma proteobacterium endosymbiont of Lamellibrachia anaximandri]MBL3599920.1 hypothetical protein [gamma proteobacterium endosymbiont of Lamellibrachia anaximandri]MBL3617398.1 hypothetical protein [gamma proteobacterium endosymbiont of Lamellibrachia anaximandri]
MKTLTAMVAAVLICTLPVFADESSLQQRVTDLEKRVATIEQLLEETNAKGRWKDPVIWRRIKKEMSSDEVQRLLGKPGRVEEQIFTTWYYHPSSKLHSFVWFDEGKVLGWEAPE